MGRTKLGAVVLAAVAIACACSKSATHGDAAASGSSGAGGSIGDASSSASTSTSSNASSGASSGSSSTGATSTGAGGGDAGSGTGGSGTGGGAIAVGAGACTSLPMQGKVITVAGFDQAAITSAIAGASAGDTVLFPAGTYAVTGTLSLAGGVLYHGDPGAVLQASGGTTTIAKASGAAVAGVSLDGLTFDGGNIILSGDTTHFSAGVNVINCTIENVTSAASFGAMQGILADHLTGSRFDCNTFTKNGVVNQESYALIVYTTNQSSFSHNLLTSTYQGFHFESADTTGGNGLTVSYNQADSLLAIGIEFNKNASNAVVEHNTLGNWRSGNANGMALSIVPTGSNNSVRYNDASGAGCSTCNIGIEASGTDSYFEDNTIDGFYTNIAVSCATGTTFSGNVMNDAGMWGPFDKDGGYCGGEIIGTNTINGVTMTGYPL